MCMHSALLIPKEHLDCDVLYPLDVQDESHPFSFNGLKCGAMQWPNKGGKSRDMWYFESTGMAIATDEFGREHDYGYCFMESFELPQCSQLDAFSIVRAKVSMRHIFRELPRICRSRAKTPRDAKKSHKEPKESKKIMTKIQPAKGTTTTTDAAPVML
ncbi:hypothetical protein LEN26_009169 [Aphanomyces euteiches]|nr:hypothetical protein LEN26_009169 [Aphanomyces euteiches]